MIPTSVTSSSPPTACLGSIGNQTNSSPTPTGCAKSSNGANVGTDGLMGQGQCNNSAFLGIASLILEGRALAEDEYAIQPTRYDRKTSLCGNSIECGRQSPKPSTSRAAFGDNNSSNVGSSSLSIDLVNYLGRKSSRSPESSSSSFVRDYYNSSSSESASSSVDSNHSRWSQKLSQLRQESPNGHHQAMMARQKVAVECPRGSDAEYVALSINTDHHHNQYGVNEDKRGSDFEILRRMSINQMNFYNSPNSMVGGGGSSGSGSGSSENFMCSLQSLASNTCLRVGSPLLITTTSPPPKYYNNRQISSSTPRFATPQYQQQLDYSIGTPGSSCSSSGGILSHSRYASSSPYSINSSSSNISKASTTAQRVANSKTLHSSSSNIFGRYNYNCVSPIPTAPEIATTTTMATAMTSSSSATTSRNKTHPQQGPHCDQFLRKMGLAKGDASEAEEHHCDMSYVSLACTRWRAYCIKMENILACGDPICIEVYLGPVNQKVLLEQWIITQKEKQPPPTMTLPSLCSAIRSQLYFSQISAWCDLIKKSDKTVKETGRVIFATPNTTTSAAGDLATTTNNAMMTATAAPTATSATSIHHHTTSAVLALSAATQPASGSGNAGGVGSVLAAGVGCGKRRTPSPRLNIFYRIKQYDSTACFNSKPNVHNFPNVNISENCCISVCLKSLPRIAGGIPKVGTAATTTTATATATATTTATGMQQQNIPTSSLLPVNCETRMACINKTYNAANAAKATTSAASTNAATVAAGNSAAVVVAANILTTIANKSTILKMNCDNNLKEHQQQQKPFTASNTSNSNSSSSTASSSSSSSSLRCSYLLNKNNSKPSLGEMANEECLNDQDLGDVDFECYNENRNNLDLSAGGDNTGISFGSDMVGDSAASVGDCDSSNSSFSTNNCGSLSHREKQLLKYRKRMMKRDKKQQLRNHTTNQMRLSMQERISNNNNNNTNNNNNRNENSYNKMEQGDDEDDDGDDHGDLNVDDVAVDGDEADVDADTDKSDTADCCSERKRNSVNNCLTKGQRQKQQLPKNHKISIPYTNQNQHHHVKMISTGTQTITDTCTSCGSEKSMICLKCNPLKTNNDDENVASTATATATTTATTSTSTLTDFSYNYEEIMDAESSSSASSLSSSDIIHTPRNKAELLLQAIQRTPKSNKKHKHKSKDSNQMAAIKLQQQQEKQQQQQQQQQNSPTTAIATTSTLKNSNNKNLRNSPQNFNTLNSDNRTIISHHSNSRSSSASSIINGIVTLNNSNNSSNNIIGCQVCKRQKTQHNFNQPANEDANSDDNNSLASNSLSSPSCGKALVVGKTTNQSNQSLTDDDKAADDDDNEKDGGKIFLGDCVDNISIVFDIDHENYATKMSTAKSCDSFSQNEIMEQEYFETSTKLTPHIDRCSLNVKTSSFQRSNTCGANGVDNVEYGIRACSTPPLDEQKENSSKIEGGGITLSAQFKTPTPSKQHQNEMMKNKTLQPLQPHKHTLKPNLLHIAYNFNKTDDQHIAKVSHDNGSMNAAPPNQNPLLLRRSLPKVNLTPIFCNTNSVMTVTSSPIPIVKGVCNGSTSANGLTIKSADINATKASPTFSFESPSSPAPSAMVQKSNSAPTLPNSPSLSPRFVKASAIYKRRSRHLSDRSDRSSLGSDEQISDEDIDSGMYSPFATSPVKLRTRLTAVFGRKPLLGNLEESLLQRRLVPKIEVMGFKLLLGASGGFCPTQLTIPAAAYFYELKGETLSTPYMCEIRLPRKGYTVPRCGTVQATLLNPMGTVVRMFVIPYDMRDMPSYHQTFIRQRILADTGLQTHNENQQKGFDGALNNVIASGSESSSLKNIKHQKLGQPNQSEKQFQEQASTSQQQQRSPQSSNENHLGHFISAENMKSLRYSIHLRFQTSRTGRLMLHTDIRLLISRRTDCDTAAAHAKGVLEAPNELVTNTMMPKNPKYSARQDQTSSKI